MKKWPRDKPGPIGTNWRVLAHDAKGGEIALKNEGRFDELVLEHAIHLEQMEGNTWWMRIGEAHLWITIGGDGYVQRATITEGVKRVCADGRIELEIEDNG